MQTKSLLQNGYAVGRGDVYANGSAHAHGTAFAKGKSKKKKKQEKAKKKVEKVLNKYESKRAIKSAHTEYLASDIELRKNQGQNLTRSDYSGLINSAQADADAAYTSLQKYQAAYNKNKKNMSAADKRAAQEQIEKLKKSWTDAKNAVLEYQAEAIKAEIDSTQNVLNKLKAQAELIDNINQKDANMAEQISNTVHYYDLLIENEKNSVKQAELKAQKEKAVRDLLQQQLEYIKSYNSYMSDYYTSGNTLYQAQNQALKEATGKDSAVSKSNVAKNNAAVQSQIAQLNKENADRLYQALHTSDYGTFVNGQFVVKEGMFEQYTKGMTDYNNMLADSYNAEAEAAQSLYDAWVAEYLEPAQQRLADLQTAAELFNSQIDLNNAKGIKTTADDYRRMIENSQSQAASLKAQNATLKSQQKLYDVGSTKYKELQSMIDANNKALVEAEKSQAEWNNAIIQLNYDKFDEALKRLDAIEKHYESIISLNSQLGRDSTEGDYLSQIAINESKLAQLNQEVIQAWADYEQSRSTGYYGGKTSDEWLSQYYDLRAQINSVTAEVDKLRDSMRDDIYWRNFERAHKVAERLERAISGITKLIDDDMSFDADGNLTAFGITQMSLLTKQFENAQTQVGNYADDIRNLNNLYSRGLYTELEYQEKLSELQNNLLGSASDMKSYLTSLKNMYKQMDQSELDTLKELISKRKEALNKKKAYYDYDKTLKDKTKDIQELKAQIEALNGVTNAEARAKMARLTADLTEAEQDLADTRRSHAFDLSSDALDEMENVLQDQFDEKWEKLGTSLEDIQNLLSDAKSVASKSADTVAIALNKLLAFYGIPETNFASGTRRVSSSLVGLSNEAGSEILVTKNGIISHFNPGDGVVPSALTQRLYAMASGQMPIMSGGGSTHIEQHFDALINIEGSADAATVEDLKRISKDLLEKSYKYTSQRIHDGYIKAGGRRAI